MWLDGDGWISIVGVTCEPCNTQYSTVDVQYNGHSITVAVLLDGSYHYWCPSDLCHGCMTLEGVYRILYHAQVGACFMQKAILPSARTCGSDLMKHGHMWHVPHTHCRYVCRGVADICISTYNNKKPDFHDLDECSACGVCLMPIPCQCYNNKPYGGFNECHTYVGWPSSMPSAVHHSYTTHNTTCTWPHNTTNTLHAAARSPHSHK